MKGTLAHKLLEEKLRDEKPLEEVLDGVLEDWVVNDCKIELMDYEMLKEYILLTSPILKKATEAYTGSDKIRTRDGKIPKVPSMTTAYKKQAEEKGLDELKLQLNLLAQKSNVAMTVIDFANVAANGYFCSSNFELPEWTKKVIAVEHRFEDSDSDLLWERESNIDKPQILKWLGGPDLVLEAVTGETVILDHKTGSSCPTSIDVGWHPQLHLYAYLYEKQTGIGIDGVGISHLPTGKVILEKVRPETVRETFSYLNSIQDMIDLGLFPKHLPTEFNSPCVTYGSMKEEDCCEYIKDCWPDYWYEHHKPIEETPINVSTVPPVTKETFNAYQYF